MMQFGKKIEGLEYKDRPGAYAVVFNDKGEIAVMKTPRGNFLPGGGTDGENPATALAREALEETGMGIRIIKEIGVAAEFCFMPEHTYGFNKIGTFFVASFTKKECEPCEDDHELLWLGKKEAREQLTRDFQKWAIDKAVS